MTSIYPKSSPGSQPPPEPTPLKKQAHYAWVTSPPQRAPIRQLFYVGTLAKEHFSQEFPSGGEVMTKQTAFRAHHWLSQLASREEADLPQAILCDLTLPDGDIYSFFDRIQHMLHIQHIPFFAVSEKSDQETAIRLLQAGIDDLYTPAFTRSDLESRIHFLQANKPFLRESPLESQALIEVHPAGPKRMLDVWIALLGLICLSPLLLIIALLIKFGSKGSVLQKTECAGIGYQVFTRYKFRTSWYEENKEGSEQVSTRLGSWLIRHNLNELPQLINILQGDMSLVGNRPLPLEEAEQLTTDQWAKRFLAPAGVTGLWQLARRSGQELSEEVRRQLDIDYADNASFGHDIHILAKTILILLRRSAK